MQVAVKELLAIGPLPASHEASAEKLNRFEGALKGVAPPVTQEEAIELAKLFGPDDCFGLAWSLLHLVETATDVAQILDKEDGTNLWISAMRDRLAAGSQ